MTWWLLSIHLKVHLCEADEHPGNEALPEANGNEAHLKETLQRVVGVPVEAVDVHGWLWRKEMWQ